MHGATVGAMTAPTSTAVSAAVQVGPTCWIICRGRSLVLALNADGNDAAQIEIDDLWPLLDALEDTYYEPT
jgi:hypothetical protein